MLVYNLYEHLQVQVLELLLTANVVYVSLISSHSLSYCTAFHVFVLWCTDKKDHLVKRMAYRYYKVERFSNQQPTCTVRDLCLLPVKTVFNSILLIVSETRKSTKLMVGVSHSFLNAHRCLKKPHI